MGAHRYWSIYIRRNSGDASFTGLTEIEFRATVGGSDETGSGTASVDPALQAGSPGDAFDGNLTNLIQWSGQTNKRVTYDFGVGVEKDIREVLIYPNKDAATRSPGYFEVQYSDNGTTWTTAFFGIYTAWVIGTPVTFSAPLTSSVRYWALTNLVSGGSGAYSIAELELRNLASGVDLTGLGTATASTEFAGSLAPAAVDDNFSTLWSSNNEPAGVPVWWRYDLGAGNEDRVIQVSITARLTSFFNQTPHDFDLAYSADGRTYVVRENMTTTADWTSGETRVFSTTEFVQTIVKSKIPSDMNNFPLYLKGDNYSSDFWSNVEDDGGNIRLFMGPGGDVVPPDTLPDNSNNWGGYTLRQVIAASQFSQSSRRFRVALETRNSGSGASISGIYIGRAGSDTGSDESFFNTPTQLFFDGSASISMASGEVERTDWADIIVDNTHDVVVSVQFDSGSAQHLKGRNILTGFVAREKLGADAATVVTTGYATSTEARIFVKMIECTPAEVPLDLVKFDGTTDKASMFSKIALCSAVDNKLTMEVGGSMRRQPLVDEALGRNDVWSDYEFVAVPFDTLTDRTGKNSDGTEINGPLTTGEPTGTRPNLAGGGAVTLDGTQTYEVNVPDVATLSGIFTLGVSFNSQEDLVTDNILTYRDESAGASEDRVSIEINSNRIVLWDDANGILEPASNVDPNIGEWYRVHATYNATTARTLTTDGGNIGNDISITSVSPRGYDMLSIGREDPSENEVFDGFIGWYYLIEGVLSPDRRATEFDNLNDPDGFLSMAPPLNANTGEFTLTGQPVGIEVFQPVRATQLPILTVDDANQPVRATQLPIMVIGKSGQPIRLTQLPILTVAVSIQPVRLTQLPITPTIKRKPIPLPVAIRPEVPVMETWEWLTTLNLAGSSREQRMGLREFPRYIMALTLFIQDEATRVKVYQIIKNFLSAPVVYPMYQYFSVITTGTTASGVKLFFNPTLTDMRDGEQIALFDPMSEETYYQTIATVDADGCTLTTPLQFDVPAGWYVCPALTWQLDGSSALSMSSVTGSGTLTLTSIGTRVLDRPSAPVVIPTLDGMPVLEKRPTSDDLVVEGFEQNVTWFDNNMSLQAPFTMWKTAFVNGNRKFKFNRFVDMDYWRAFGTAVKGQLNPFLMSTFRDDLPLVEQPVVDAIYITTNNLQYGHYFYNLTYRYVQIENENGIIHRRVNNIVINYDANGDPETITLELTNSLGANVGDNVVSRVSFLNVVRLNSDDMIFEHDGYDGFVSFDVRTINQ